MDASLYVSKTRSPYKETIRNKDHICLHFGWLLLGVTLYTYVLPSPTLLINPYMPSAHIWDTMIMQDYRYQWMLEL